MLAPRQEIARERRRMMQVRQALRAGLADGPWQESGRAAFCRACAGYLVFSMDRLHAQDQRIRDLLTARLPASETGAHHEVAQVHAAQELTRALVETLRRDMAEAGGIEAALAHFLERLSALAGPRRNPLSPWTDTLFEESDWQWVADVTPASLSAENRLFQSVRDAAMPAWDPEQFSAQHLPAADPGPRVSL